VLEALVALIVKHAPLVLLLDDLQWADPRTIAALEYLLSAGARERGATASSSPPPCSDSLLNPSCLQTYSAPMRPS
jgi:hypothetical protein